MGDAELEHYKLWRIRRTLYQMLRDRGYNFTEKEVNMSLEEFKDQCENGCPSRKDLITFANHSEDPSENLFVFFPDGAGKVDIKTIKMFVTELQKENRLRGILVLGSAGITPSAKTAMAQMSPKYILEHFFESELMVNITEHELVPKHIVMTPSEKTELMNRYSISESQLPKIQQGDPVARYLGLRRGQVVKIIRPSETAGRYVSYRIVV